MRRIPWGIGLLAMLATACATPKGSTVAEKRAAVNDMASQTLQSFYAASPALRKKVSSAAGYAVFSSVKTHLLLVAAGHGYGVAVSNATGKRTYMRMARLGGGPGLGLASVRVLFVFHSAGALRSFIDTGFEVAGEAQAAATAGDVGAAASAGASVGSSGGAGTAGAKAGGAVTGSGGTGMDVYQLTEAGAALEAVVSGTKYWKDGKLN
jgi:lipid-binding SYLF domain-containing protein